jgi:hypothetical protein
MWGCEGAEIGRIGGGSFGRERTVRVRFGVGAERYAER